MVRTKLTFDTTNLFYSLQETLFKTICTRARVHTAPRPCGGAYFVRDIAPGHHASAQHKSTRLRPSERPPLQQSMAAGWSIGAASSARKNRRLLTLPDDPQMGASEPTPGSLGEGLAGGRRPFCSAGGMCCEGRGLFGAKKHLVMLPPWCARNERSPDRVRGLVLGSVVRRSVRRGRNRAAAGVRAVLVRFPRLRVKG